MTAFPAKDGGTLSTHGSVKIKTPHYYYGGALRHNTEMIILLPFPKDTTEG